MGTPRAEEILAQLPSLGLRSTMQRRIIVETLLESSHHITAEDLTQALQHRVPEVHAATVYRTLEVLETLGVIYRLDSPRAGTEWHLAERAHQHLVCDNCGTVTEVSEAAFARLANALARDHGFIAETRHITVRGRCAACSP